MKFKQGTITGTGSAINVEVGFVPDYVKVVNENAIEGEIMVLESFKAQLDGDSVATWSILDNGTDTTKNIGIEGTNGLSEYDASDIQITDPITNLGFAGFTIPAAFQDNADVMHYIAMAE